MISFHLLAEISTFLCFALGITWLLAPQLLLSLWGLNYSPSLGLVSRRGAALFFAIGTMFFLARNAAPSQSRAALSAGFAVGCLVFAVLGVFELTNKRANKHILLAVLVEMLLGISFIVQMLSETKNFH